ncbi:MAG TPA: hypothetical protein VHG91_03680 [Longimicrobium sp.]|nr:hypothetical protein [Longimicrobium sp.]
MATPRRPSVETLRYAAERAVERSSLRPVARAIGRAASWLDGFIAGKPTELRAQTIRKLHEWFVRESAGLQRLDRETAGAAASVLVSGILDPDTRQRAYDEILDVLARAYGGDGPEPDWLTELRRDEESPES